MEDGEVGRFPPLPNPQQPWEPGRGAMTIPRGANWMPATRGRPVVTRRGGLGGHAPPRLPTLIIPSVEELERHLDAANIPGNELALSCMRAYIRDAQNVPREMRSPVQNMGTDEMEDTRLGASRDKAAWEGQQAECTTGGKHAQVDRPGRGLGKVDVEIP